MSWDPESWLWNLFIWRDELEPWILDNDIGHHQLKLLSGISTRGGTYLFLQIILQFNHLDQMKYLLSRPPCWTPLSACPRVVTGQLLALWKGWPPLICESVLVEYHCELVTTVTPYDEIYQVGAAIALFCIIFGSSLGVQGQEPSEQGGEGAMRSTHDHWSPLSLCLIENVIKKNPNGHSTSSIPHSGVDGRGGYAGKEVTCACTGIFHKESAVCTLNCMLNFLSVFDGATVFRQRHDRNWSIKQSETMFANPTKLP